MKYRKTASVARKHSQTGDSGRSVGLKTSTNGHAQKLGFSVNTIGPVLFPLSPTQTDRKVLSLAVRSVVAEMKK